MLYSNWIDYKIISFEIFKFISYELKIIFTNSNNILNMRLKQAWVLLHKVLYEKKWCPTFKLFYYSLYH